MVTVSDNTLSDFYGLDAGEVDKVSDSSMDWWSEYVVPKSAVGDWRRHLNFDGLGAPRASGGCDPDIASCPDEAPAPAASAPAAAPAAAPSKEGFIGPVLPPGEFQRYRTEQATKQATKFTFKTYWPALAIVGVGVAAAIVLGVMEKRKRQPAMAGLRRSKRR